MIGTAAATAAGEQKNEREADLESVVRGLQSSRRKAIQSLAKLENRHFAGNWLWVRCGTKVPDPVRQMKPKARRRG